MQRPILDLLRGYEVQVDLDIDVDAFSIYEEFKNYDELIGIYVFTPNRNYLLLYGSTT